MWAPRTRKPCSKGLFPITNTATFLFLFVTYTLSPGFNSLYSFNSLKPLAFANFTA